MATIIATPRQLSYVRRKTLSRRLCETALALLILYPVSLLLAAVVGYPVEGLLIGIFGLLCGAAAAISLTAELAALRRGLVL